MINVKLEKIVALQTGKIKSLYCRCVEPVGYLKMNKSVANRTLIHSRLKKSTKTCFYLINCIVEKVQSACELKTDGHKQASRRFSTLLSSVQEWSMLGLHALVLCKNTPKSHIYTVF